MLVENSIVVANFIKGLFLPIGIISVFTALALIILWFGTFIPYEEPTKQKFRDKLKKFIWVAIPELGFALWFFSTFTLR